MKIAARTDIGLSRELHEDCYFVSETPVGMFEKLLIVSDGMGGHDAGEVASRMAVDAVVSYLETASINMPLFTLEQAVYAANLEVRKYSEANDGIDLGTTLVICGIISGHAYVANVGDSRLYLLNRYAYSIRQITKDHSYVEEMVARGLMTRNSEEYMRQKQVITRAVGFFPETEPDLFDFGLEEGDMILLCTDGLTNMLKNVVIKNLALDDSFTLEKRADTLIDEANRMGGRDNITVILAEREDQDD